MSKEDYEWGMAEMRSFVHTKWTSGNWEDKDVATLAFLMETVGMEVLSDVALDPALQGGNKARKVRNARGGQNADATAASCT